MPWPNFVGCFGLDTGAFSLGLRLSIVANQRREFPICVSESTDPQTMWTRARATHKQKLIAVMGDAGEWGPMSNYSGTWRSRHELDAQLILDEDILSERLGDEAADHGKSYGHPSRSVRGEKEGKIFWWERRGGQHFFFRKKKTAHHEMPTSMQLYFSNARLRPLHYENRQ